VCRIGESDVDASDSDSDDDNGDDDEGEFVDEDGDAGDSRAVREISSSPPDCTPVSARVPCSLASCPACVLLSDVMSECAARAPMDPRCEPSSTCGLNIGYSLSIARRTGRGARGRGVEYTTVVSL
jgi:hypothetical protein